MRHASSGVVVKAIAAVGGFGFVFLLVLVASYGLEGAFKPDDSQRVSLGRGLSPFKADRAFEDLKSILSLGPRPSASVGMDAQRTYLKRELGKVGLTIREQAFDAETPIGTVRMVNLVAIVEGTDPRILIIGNHYDTKMFDTFTFLGANDGGSTTAWMLEMARVLGPKRMGLTIWLCWFDGEEAIVDWTQTDSLYGSRAFVKELQNSNQARQVAGMINVDMIGDCYLGIQKDRGAPGWLQDTIWAKAQELNYGKHFLATSQSIDDDHMPFRTAGIASMDIIDFRYGGSIVDHARTWHTAEDTLDKVCPGSLQAVGDVIYHALSEIDAASRRGQGLGPR